MVWINMLVRWQQGGIHANAGQGWIWGTETRFQDSRQRQPLQERQRMLKEKAGPVRTRNRERIGCVKRSVTSWLSLVLEGNGEDDVGENKINQPKVWGCLEIYFKLNSGTTAEELVKTVLVQKKWARRNGTADAGVVRLRSTKEARSLGSAESRQMDMENLEMRKSQHDHPGNFCPKQVISWPKRVIS